MPDIPPSEAEYLRQIEVLANDVADQALGEGWLSFAPDPDDATPLQRAVNALARQLRHYHFEGDGCTDPDAAPLDLAGALLISPPTMGNEQRYTDICVRLGVDPRREGWALWHSWDRRGRRVTLVTSNQPVPRWLPP